MDNMEIERKWMVGSWPELPPDVEHQMEQSYLSVNPLVRIRKEAETGGETVFMLCFKSQGRLARREIEFPIGETHYRALEEMIGRPPIKKLRRCYALPDGHVLEVSEVDAGMPKSFVYAEVEFATEEEARTWQPEAVGLGAYLDDEVTELPGQSMSDYWVETRLSEISQGVPEKSIRWNRSESE